MARIDSRGAAEPRRTRIFGAGGLNCGVWTSKARLLFVVEDRLEIDGQERILVPEVNSTGNNERFHVEDPVRLRKPDGTYGLAAIAEIMLLHGQVGRVGVLLRNMTKAEVPIGTEVWSIDRTE